MYRNYVLIELRLSSQRCQKSLCSIHGWYTSGLTEESAASGLVNGSMELAKLIEGEVHPEVALVSKRWWQSAVTFSLRVYQGKLAFR